MSVKEVMTSLADAVRGRYSVTNKLTVTDMIDLINSENIDVAKLIDRSITEITVPEGVTEIGKEAFRGCNQLTEVTLPSTVMSIGTNTFADCDDLEHVVCAFPKNIGGFPWGAPEDIFTFLTNEIDVEGGPLKFTATSSDTRITLKSMGYRSNVDGILYKTNTMNTFEYYPINHEIILNNVDDFVLFQNETTHLSRDPDNYVYFSSNKTEAGYPKVSGNVLSMLGGSDVASEYCFCYLFKDFKTNSKPFIPDFAELAEGCCYHMYDRATFRNDSGTTYLTFNSGLKKSCCEGMFYGATLDGNIEIKIPKSSWQSRAYYNFMKDVVGLNSYSDVIIEFESWPSDSLECMTEWLPNASVTFDAPRFQITRYLDKYIRDTSHIPSNWRIRVSTDLSCSVTTPVSLRYSSNTDMILNPPTVQLVATVSDPTISPKFYFKTDGFVHDISAIVTTEGLFTVLNKPYSSSTETISAEFIVCVYYAGDPLQSTHLVYSDTIPHEEIVVTVKYRKVEQE